jgi:hypothetical protein
VLGGGGTAAVIEMREIEMEKKIEENETLCFSCFGRWLHKLAGERETKTFGINRRSCVPPPPFFGASSKNMSRRSFGIRRGHVLSKMIFWKKNYLGT